MADHRKKGGGNILIYCNMGVSRSALIAAAAIARFEEMDFVHATDAVELLRKSRPIAAPNALYMTVLERFVNSSPNDNVFDQTPAGSLLHWLF